MNAGKKSPAGSGKKLLHQDISAWEKLSASETREIMRFAEGYKSFLGEVKTERECVLALEKELRRQGFKALSSEPKLAPGGRVFKNIKGRALAAAVIGNPKKTWRFIGAHLDSPRLDLKPNPLFEEGSLAMVQTHYYGGIKKYQWVNVPLSLHAVVHTKNGTRSFVIGEKPGEPQFIIPDMPPHLSREQMDKSAKEAVKGEQLRVVVGNRPLEKSKASEKVKLAVLDYLHQAYGLVEKDLFSADISLVPAAKPVDLGFDRALLAAYGQDDRACVYTAFQALLQARKPVGVACLLLVDKEEIGSEGNTGAQSRLLENFVAEVVKKLRLDETEDQVLERATAVSADVTEALNPNFKDVSDPRNVSYLGRGVSVEKYGGGGGKYSTNDASSEYMSWLVRLLESKGIAWQTGELGRLDLGGGGTIAMYLARTGMDAIDAGPPLLSMHSTYELSSKVDIYQAYRCYEAFLQA